MAEQCSVVTVAYKSVALARLESGEQPLLTKNSSTSGSSVSIHAAPAFSLFGQQPLFSLFCLIPTTTSSPVTSSYVVFLSFLTQEPGPCRGHECIFSKDMVPQLWTHNSIQFIFLLTGKSCLVAALVTDMLIMQVFC